MKTKIKDGKLVLDYITLLFRKLHSEVFTPSSLLQGITLYLSGLRS